MLTLSRRLLSSSSRTTPSLFAGITSKEPPSPTQRKVAQTVREGLERIFASGIIKDKGFDNGAAVYIVDVQVAKSNRIARVLWEPMDDSYDVNRVHRALTRKAGIIRTHVNTWLNRVRCPALLNPCIYGPSLHPVMPARSMPAAQKNSVLIQFMEPVDADRLNAAVAQQQSLYTMLRDDQAARDDQRRRAGGDSGEADAEPMDVGELDEYEDFREDQGGQPSPDFGRRESPWKRT